MKPCNFPQRKLRRQARANWRAGAPVSEAQARAESLPTDIRFRIGARNRNS